MVIPPRLPPPGVFGGPPDDGTNGNGFLDKITALYYWILVGLGLTVHTSPPQRPPAAAAAQQQVPEPAPAAQQQESAPAGQQQESAPAAPAGDDPDPSAVAAAVSAFRTDWAVSLLGFLTIGIGAYVLHQRSKNFKFPQSRLQIKVGNLRIEHERTKRTDTSEVRFGGKFRMTLGASEPPPEASNPPPPPPPSSN